ncbi:MAG TPA: AMP-binding protein, partial [Chthonomonadales bacterium]|nr:AMP-binding protein [Chthonomonadales bacterium]
AVDSSRLKSTAELLEASSARLLLVHSNDDQIASTAIPSSVKHILPVRDAAASPLQALPGVQNEDLAYILYTSGSTGVPKGVAHTHRSALAFTQWIQNRFEITREDRFSNHAPFHFDLSISDLYASLGSGASVRLISSLEGMLAPYLVRAITEWQITVWYSVPSILSAMLDQGNLEELGLPTVRLLFFAGEVFPTPQLRRLRRALPHARMFNLFGPTETNVCTYFEVPAALAESQTAPIPIGKRCEHLETFVLNEAGEPVNCGEEGCLWVKGDNLMQSYWNDAERTAAALVADPRPLPVSSTIRGPAYNTGDRVREMAGGDYEFLGRRDHMVKTRGFRVELGDIEAVLSSHDAVLEAVAVALPDLRLGNRIVASVVAREGAALDAESLRSHCRRRVPLYMVPDSIEVRPCMPRTSSGKADRNSLQIEWERKEVNER